MNTAGLPQDPQLAGQLIAAEAQHTSTKLERGWMGIVFGTGLEKPGNVAAGAMLLSFFVIMVLIFAPVAEDVPKREIITLFGGVFTAALGYVFGHTASQQ